MSLEVAKMSATVKTLLEDLGYAEDKPDTIPLPNVRGEILRLVVNWCNQHKVKMSTYLLIRLS